MKTHLQKMLFVAVLCLGWSNLKAQYMVGNKEVDTTFNTKMNHIFGNLDKSHVPYGLLKDYAMEFTNLQSYNGTVMADSTLLNKTLLYDIYNTLVTARVTAAAYATLPTADVTDSVWYIKRQPGTVAVAGLFYQYAYLDRNALANNKITVSGDQYFDKFIGGVYQSPYLTGMTLGFAPATEVYMGKNFSILMTDSLWLSNSKTLVDHIEVDAADGLGYRTITPNTPLSVSYADTGLKVWNFKLFLTNSTVLQSHTRLQVIEDTYGQNVPPSSGGGLSTMGVVAGPPTPGSTPASAFYYVTSSETYLGMHALGYVTVQYASGHTSIQKPLIVVEGFDPGRATHPEIPTGDYSLYQFNRSVGASSNLADALHGTSGYDIIFIDYYDGTDDMHRNALLVKEVIRWVNSVKTTAEPNVVLGLSMGGPVARYALKTMENAGENHQTGLYVSMDGAQQGANVPLAYQYFVNHARMLYYRAGVGVALYNLITFFSHKSNNIPDLLNLSNRPAVSQLLMNYIDNNENFYNNNHNSWQAELTALGYPNQNGIRNIAISNGSECGQTQALSPGGLLFSATGNLKTGIALDGLAMFALPITGVLLGQPGLLLGVLPGSNTITMDFQMNASAASGGGNQVYHGNITYTKKFLWIANISVNLTDRTRNAPNGSRGYDHVGGGIFDEIGPLSGSSLNIPWVLSYGINLTGPAAFCGMPTPSALDIASDPTSLSGADYLAAYSEGNPPVSPKNTPFANFVTAHNGSADNESHITFEGRNGQWLANELKGLHPTESCSLLCQQLYPITYLSGSCNTTMYQVANLPPGLSIQWSVNDKLVIQGPSNQPTVNIGPHPINNGLGIITATIGIIGSSSCGTVASTFQVIVGAPAATIVGLASGSELCANSSSNAFVDTGYGSYNWSISNGTIVSGQGTAEIRYVVNDYNDSNTGGYLTVAVTDQCGRGVPQSPIAYFTITQCGPGGGGDNSVAIKIYPNPGTDNVHISSNIVDTTAANRKIVGAPYSYKLYDVLGRVVRTGRSTGSEATIDVAGLAPAIYYMNMIFDDKRVVRKQILVLH